MAKDFLEGWKNMKMHTDLKVHNILGNVTQLFDYNLKYIGMSGCNTGEELSLR